MITYCQLIQPGNMAECRDNTARTPNVIKTAQQCTDENSPSEVVYSAVAISLPPWKDLVPSGCPIDLVLYKSGPKQSSIESLLLVKSELVPSGSSLHAYINTQPRYLSIGIANIPWNVGANVGETRTRENGVQHQLPVVCEEQDIPRVQQCPQEDETPLPRVDYYNSVPNWNMLFPAGFVRDQEEQDIPRVQQCPQEDETPLPRVDYYNLVPNWNMLFPAGFVRDHMVKPGPLPKSLPKAKKTQDGRMGETQKLIDSKRVSVEGTRAPETSNSDSAVPRTNTEASFNIPYITPVPPTDTMDDLAAEPNKSAAHMPQFKGLRGPNDRKSTIKWIRLGAWKNANEKDLEEVSVIKSVQNCKCCKFSKYCTCSDPMQSTLHIMLQVLANFRITSHWPARQEIIKCILCISVCVRVCVCHEVYRQHPFWVAIQSYYTVTRNKLGHISWSANGIVSFL